MSKEKCPRCNCENCICGLVAKIGRRAKLTEEQRGLVVSLMRGEINFFEYFAKWRSIQ